MKIPLSKPYFDDAEIREVKRVLNSGWVTQGPVNLALENAVKKYLQVKYVCPCSNGTTALQLALEVNNFLSGQEVLVPSYTFVASANAIANLGGTPVFVDIDNNYNIDVGSIKKIINNHYKYHNNKLVNKKTNNILFGIMPIHQYGIPAQLDSIGKLAQKYKLTIIEDAACALGSKYKKKFIGNSNNICCFSLHPRKIITCGEGGFVITNNQKIYRKINLLKSHGIKYNKNKTSCVVRGYNYRLSDINAAVALAQIKKIHKIIKQRGVIADKYNSFLSQYDFIQLPQLESGVNCNYQSYIFYLKNLNVIDRDKLISFLNSKGIAATKGITPLHLSKVYKKSFLYEPLNNTEKIYRSAVMLPIYNSMTDAELQYIFKTWKYFI